MKNKTAILTCILIAGLLSSFQSKKLYHVFQSAETYLSSNFYYTDNTFNYKATASSEKLLKIRFQNTCKNDKQTLEYVEKNKDESQSTIKLVDPVDPDNYIIIKYIDNKFMVIRASVQSITNDIISLNTWYQTAAALTLGSSQFCNKSIVFVNSKWSYSQTILTSCNSRYELKLQSDGNLVIYKEDKPIWSTQTYNNKINRLHFQLDGNLVLYDINEKPIWSSNTWGKKGHKLIMQDDGNLVMYDCSWNALWSSQSYERNK